MLRNDPSNEQTRRRERNKAFDTEFSFRAFIFHMSEIKNLSTSVYLSWQENCVFLNKRYFPIQLVAKISGEEYRVFRGWEYSQPQSLKSYRNPQFCNFSLNIIRIKEEGVKES